MFETPFRLRNMASPAEIPGMYTVGPGSGDYDEARKLRNRVLDFRPALIAYAYDEAEIARAVRWGAERDLAVSIRSGGHDYAGFSLNDGGLTIDVSRCDRIVVSDDGRSCRCGPGVTLRKLYHELFSRGASLPGGTCGTVAVAGLTLGGGVGFLVREHGLLCDRLSRIRCVDAGGNVRDSADGPGGDDLLWACRGGGGGNFGVVSEFTFQTVAAPPTVTTFSYKWDWDKDLIAQIVPLFAAWSDEAALAIGASLVVTGRVRNVVHLFGVSKLSESDTRDALRRFSALGPMVENIVAQTPYLAAVESFAGSDFDFASWKMASSFCAGTPNEPAIAAIVEALDSAPLPGLLIEFDLLGGAFAKIKPDATAFPHRDAKMMLQYMTYWGSPGDEVASRAWLKQAFAAVDPHMGGGCYRNYPDVDLADWSERYYGANYPRLQTIKSALDPNARFRFPQSIAPLPAPGL